jgi:hypothetical protein
VGNNTWDNLLDPTAVVRGSSVSNGVTTIQDLTPAPLPTTYANELKLGSHLVIEAIGEATSSASTIPTLILSLWVGSTATVIAASAAVTLTASQTSVPWHLRWNGLVTAVGASATAALYGHGILDISLVNLDTYVPKAMPTTAGARALTTGLDTTVLNKWGVAATFSNTTAGNSARCDVFNVQILNQGKT